jgi:hypothetical protein
VVGTGRGSVSPGLTNAILRVDAHHYVWDLTVRDQPWTTELPLLRRSLGFAELCPGQKMSGTCWGLVSPGWPGQGERLSRYAGGPRVTVGLDDVMTL